MRNSETVKALVDYARQLDAPPKYNCRDRIKSRGDALVKPISWTGSRAIEYLPSRHWIPSAVTAHCRPHPPVFLLAFPQPKRTGLTCGISPKRCESLVALRARCNDG